jgi:serine/threonine protein kinase
LISALERAPELAKYELLERIGVGGMATVYRARDRRLGREVAVKLIHAHLRENKEVAARFVSEARAVARLRHPNVVEVFDVSDENEPERYLVVELVRGTTLRALLSRHKALPAELAVAIGLEVAAALSHAHEEGIVHRDVKPENVLVDLASSSSRPTTGDRPVENAKVKLTDFGIAKLLDAQGVTSTGQVLGSPAHMAPEQIEGGDVGPRADVFALGVMLYESMVGRLPFDGKNPAQVLRRVLDGTYPPADRELPTVGARWTEILARALARDAADRYESVDAFAAAMRTELERTKHGDGRREIDRFLSDQDGYAALIEAELVEELVRSGERARDTGNFLLASADFNRALAYRPGDADLVRRVRYLVRRAKWLRVARRGGALIGLAALFGSGVLWFVHRHAVSGSSRALDRAADPSEPTALAAQPSSASAAAPFGATPAPTAAHPRKRNYPVMIAPPHRAPVTRPVVVDVTGPKGGYLKIDGVREDTWFGVEHDLETGPHTFEFVPADAECCRPSPPVTHVVAEGDGVDSVLLAVAFREARLRIDKSLAGTVRCRSLFGGDLRVPGDQPVPMSRLAATGLCTLTPEDPTQGPLTKEVTLTAGQTTEISWP